MKNRILVAAAVLIFSSFARAEAAETRHMLFAGHSFFHPVATKMGQVTEKLGIEGSSQQVIVAGGKTGSPEALWYGEHADEIKRALDTGEVDLLGLTVYSEESSGIEDFRRWIDYALENNPNTSFMIGLPWGKDPATKSLMEYQQENQHWQKFLTEMIAKLKAEYPETEFQLLNYGRGAIELRRMLEAGELPDASLMGDRASAIYTDDIGHAGNALAELSVWLWVDFFYPDHELAKMAGSDRPWVTLAVQLSEE